MRKLVILGLIIGLFYSCANTNPKDKLSEKIDLPDSLFALRNIKNANLLFKVLFIENRLFLDSTKKVEFVALDSTYKNKILAPILNADLGVDKNYIKLYMSSYFISKQDKIGKYQPLIIWTLGDDYNSLILVLVDSTLKPISHIILSGGEIPGPYEINDSLSCWGEDTYSKINGNKIESYKLKTYVYTDSRNDSAFVDSISFKSQIKDNGQIFTEKLDSIRKRKLIKN